MAHRDDISGAINECIAQRTKRRRVLGPTPKKHGELELYLGERWAMKGAPAAMCKDFVVLIVSIDKQTTFIFKTAHECFIAH